MTHSRRHEPGRRGNDDEWEQEEGGDMMTTKGETMLHLNTSTPQPYCWVGLLTMTTTTNGRVRNPR